jgi:hypothetical protein
MSAHLRCQACGGSVIYDVAVAGAACLFCGSVALVAAPPEEPVPVPEGAIDFAIDRAAADAEYRAWAQRSWFHPRALRELSVELQPMLLPAWRFAGEVETHWAGLQRAGTRSGKAPVSGHERAALQYMVPASGGLGEAELAALQPFHEHAVEPWVPPDAGAHVPWEPPALSQDGARVRAHHAMAQHHAHEIGERHGLTRCRVSPVVHDHDVKLLMVPIYIGAFRFRDRPWRFVVNAQTGKVAGKAPIDRLKVALLVVAALAVIAAVVLLASVR